MYFPPVILTARRFKQGNAKKHADEHAAEAAPARSSHGDAPMMTRLLDIYCLQYDDQCHPLTGRDAARRYPPVGELLQERGDALVDVAKAKRDGRHSSSLPQWMMLVLPRY